MLLFIIPHVKGYIVCADLMICQALDAYFSHQLVLSGVLDDEGEAPGLRLVVLEIRTMPHHLGTVKINQSLHYDVYDTLMMTMKRWGYIMTILMHQEEEKKKRNK